MKLLSANAIIFLSVLFLNCGFIFPEKHEKLWCFEWKIYDKTSNTILINSNLSYRFEIVDNNNDYTIFTSLFEDTVESNGYFFIDAYSDYKEDFLKRNPYIKFKLFNGTISYLDTIIYWKNISFAEQYPDSTHHSQGNSYLLYKNNGTILNLNKLRININYK